MRIAALFLITLLVLTACARAPLKGPENAMRRTSAPELKDDLPLGLLLSAIDAQVAFLEKLPVTQYPRFVFGDDVFTREEYLQGMKHFVELGRSKPDPAVFLEAVRSEFQFYEVYGREDWGEAFITSYYSPVLEGSRKPTARFSQPLYAAPDDLLTFDLSHFDAKFAGERKLRGRAVGKSLVPYFSRGQIDGMGALKKQKLELCYVEPFDAFVLQIQGSGSVKLDNGALLHLNYAESNGHKYESLGNAMRAVLPKDQINLHTMRAYLKKLSREEMQKYLNTNPSYVFFQKTEETALTFLGVPATDGRSIATDRKYFPKGALGFLVFEKPVFAGTEELVPASTLTQSRFVLDQDIGGAITGGGRVDLFWGRDAEAERIAGAMKYPGRLYYLAPKRTR